MPLTLTALGSFFNPLVFSNVTLGKLAGKGQPNAVKTPTLNEFALKYDNSSPDPCTASYRDPTQDIVSSFNNLLFRSGVAASSFQNTTSLLDPGISIHQSVLSNQTMTLSVFKSDLRWFAGAAVLQIIAIAAIVPIFCGWWSLGVRTAMSPFEIANYFGAPLLKDVNSASSSRGINRAMGDVKVQFGAVYDSKVAVISGDKEQKKQIHKVTARLALDEAENVVRPRRGMRFDH